MTNNRNRSGANDTRAANQSDDPATQPNYTVDFSQRQSAEAITQWLQGVPVNPDTLAQPYAAVLQEAIALLPQHDNFRPQALDTALERLGSAGIPLHAEIEQASLDSIEDEGISSNLAPPLPEYAQLDPALGASAGQWIDLYIEWANAASPMTPLLFHESAALALGSIVIARRLILPMAHGRVYPNLYILWDAYSTLFRKTTALNKARYLARQTIPHLLAPQEATPEALLSDMSGREPVNLAQMSEADQAMWRQERNFSAQRGLILDEISGLLANTKKDYNAGLLESFMRFYDCDPAFTRSTSGKGRLTIHNAYLTVVGASTPSALAAHLAQEQLWANGWWPRFAILTPEMQRPSWREAREVPEPPELQSVLRRLSERLPVVQYPAAPSALNVMLGEGVHEAWQVYSKVMGYDLLTNELDKHLWALYGRLPAHVLKVATILAALDWATTDIPTPTIELSHLARAHSIVEKWRESAHRALKQASTHKLAKLEQRIVAVVQRFEPEGAALRDLRRSITDESLSEIETTVQKLITLGELEIAPAERRAGRPTDRYRIARD